MRKPEINKTPWINNQKYNPERFWFSAEQAALYREHILNDSSEWIFLYQRDDLLDKTGKESWWALYNTLANNEEYWMSAIESSILAQMWSVFKDFLTYTHHIEAGAASWKANKWKNDILPHFWKYKSYGRPFYIDVDTSWSLLQSVQQEFNETGIPAFWLQCDWRSLATMDKYDDKVFYLLWWSIGNFADDQVIEILRNFRSDSIFTWRNIILTQFLKPEEPNKQQKIDNLLNQYRCKEVEKWIMKWCGAIGIDTTKCRFCVEYEENNTKADRVKVWIECLEPMDVDIGWEKKVAKNPWEKLRAISSKRWSKNQFSALVKKAWCTMEETFTDDQKRIAVHVLKTPPKRMSMATKITATIAWTLLLVFGGVETWKMIERADRQKKQDKLKQEIVMGKQWVVNARHFTDWEEESEKMLYVFEHRYGNVISEQTREKLQVMLKDFLLSDKWQSYINKYKRMGGWPIYFDHLYVPTVLHQFVATHPNQLKNLHINTIAHSNLLKHHEALSNTYFYQWDGVSFEDKDIQEIGMYRSEHVWWVTWSDHPNNWEPDWIAVKCGIVKRKWKEYFVHKLGDDPYRLSEKNSELRSQWILSSGDMVAEIVSKWQTQIITEKIYTMLVNMYWDNYPMYINWRSDIAHWLLDWYAEGWDLEFLMYASENELWFNDNILKNFILRLCIPELWKTLEKTLNYNDIDRKWVNKDSETAWSILPTVELIHTFLDTYLWFQYTWERVQSWRVKSTLVRLLLTDNIWEKVDMCDPQIIRARITKHGATFRENGIMVPTFPEWVEKMLGNSSGPKYDPEDNFKNLKAKSDVEVFYSRSQFREWYIDINWNYYTCGVYQQKLFNNWRVVAKLINEETKELLWKKYQVGYFWKVYSESYWRVGPYELHEKWQIISRLVKMQWLYSSQNMHNLISDYAKWKQAMEKVK
jgi:uncharacterized SAM-dependent methyltransferase